MLRTQDDAKVLVGDTLADRPNPAEMPQGTTFHDVATKSWWVLCIDPVTQLRFWDRASGNSPSLLKWAGGGTVASTFLIADDPGATNAVSPNAPAYPLATARTAQNFAVNLRANPGLGAVAVTLLSNGLGILTVNFLAGTSGGIIVSPAINVVPANAVLDVQVVALSPAGVLVSATVELV